MKAILGQKQLMTRIFNESGLVIPITLIKFEKNIVTKIKNVQKDGYGAVQIGAGSQKKINKPLAGQIKDLDILPKYLFEIKTDEQLNVGDELGFDFIKEGEKVNVTAISKGKGFSGTIKRHNFHLGPKSHGSHNYRQPGSIGSAYPQRVIKGMKMAGQMGAKKTTVKNLEVIKIDQENQQILLKGAVPGNKLSAVLIWCK